MDKFAVDLEKVLDDFEYNEGREESVIPSVIKNHSSHNSQKRNKPPATIYRRPAFEPINLADADFSAASISSSDNFIKNIEDYTVTSNLVYNQPFATTTEYYSSQTENKGNDRLCKESTAIFDVSNESVEKETTHSDGTPDLLDSNILKPNTNNSIYTEDPNLSSQLPDITSVSNTLLTPALAPPDELQTSFDLIKPTAQTPSFDEKLPPIVEVGLVVKEDIPDIKIKPITFISIDNDVTESELEEYLQNLEISENVDNSMEANDNELPSQDDAPVATVFSDQSMVMKNEEKSATQEEMLQPDCSNVVMLNQFENNKDSSVDVYLNQATENLEENIVNESEEGPEDDPINELDNESLQTMYENIQGASKNTSSINDLEIISTQVTEYKNIDENVCVSEVEKCVIVADEIDAENKTPASSKSDNEDEYKDQSLPQATETCSLKDNIENIVADPQQLQEESKPCRPNSLALDSATEVDCDESPTPTNAIATNSCGPASPMERLGKFPPFWVPDTESDFCMQCQNKFTVIRRRHHCRACGLVLCSKCCNLKAPLEYLDFTEARVCQPCFNVIYRVSLEDGRYNLGRQPNPNNPMEYCSTIPPLQQAASTINQPPPSVLVPTGVLKREGGKSTMDSIVKRPLDPSTQSFIPADTNLPPLAFTENGQLIFSDEIPRITDEPVKFAINYNLFVSIKKVKLDCCVNRLCWSVCSEGLACVGQDEIAIILESLPDELFPPQDLFNLINVLYQESSKGLQKVQLLSSYSTWTFNSHGRQVVRALNHSNESVLAFGANLSLKADSHLVCIQGTKDENTYHTQAINIHNKPRRVTGASFVVFNGALKIAGLSGKSSIMEDGLMVHLPSDSMTALRTALREMQDYTISCGPNDEETVYLQWTEDDTNFNVGVKSCIDGRRLDGVPSIRVHNGTDYPGNHKIIRWTEVFILQSEDSKKAADPIDISRVSESLARATCMALVPDLDSLAAANLNMLSVRATIHPDSVGYEAGSCGVKLPSMYMKHLDEELVPVIHQAAVASQDTPAVLELTFRVMNHP
uniref:FYVE-type domain-containing protein n=1 Tax=Rhodnius prolixus TaxID=13249 RepID=T1HBW8_RHOPR